MNTKRSMGGNHLRVGDWMARRRTGEWRTMCAGLVVVASALAVLDSNPAQAVDRMNEISWAHATPSQVQSFVLYVSPVQGSVESARQIDLGKPPGEHAGFLDFFTAIVPIGLDEFVAVGAIGYDGRMSGLSEWAQPRPTQPGQPTVVQP